MNQIPSLHTLTDEELSGERVSSFSYWSDDIWLFEQSTAGLAKYASQIDWRFRMLDNSQFNDVQWTSLLNIIKRFVWSCYVTNSRGKQLKLSAIGFHFVFVRYFIRWMGQAAYTSFVELTPDSINDYLEYVIKDKVENSEDEKLASSIDRYLDVPIKIFGSPF